MRVYDTETRIYCNLRNLPWLSYLAVMHTLCQMLRAQYDDRLTGRERTLMGETLRIVSSAVDSGDGSADPSTARSLQAKWGTLTGDEGSGALPGQWNTWCTFRALAAELAGTASKYFAAERLLPAATERWREPYPGKARRIDPDEEIADSTPLAQTLAAFEEVVAAAAREHPTAPPDRACQIRARTSSRRRSVAVTHGDRSPPVKLDPSRPATEPIRPPKQ